MMRVMRRRCRSRTGQQNADGVILAVGDDNIGMAVTKISNGNGNRHRADADVSVAPNVPSPLPRRTLTASSFSAATRSGWPFQIGDGDGADFLGRVSFNLREGAIDVCPVVHHACSQRDVRIRERIWYINAYQQQSHRGRRFPNCLRRTRWETRKQESGENRSPDFVPWSMFPVPLPISVST